MVRLKWKPGNQIRDRVGIWVDSAGQLVDEPQSPPACAIADAARPSGLLAERRRGLRAPAGAHWAILIRVCNASWQHDIDSLF